MAWSRDLYVSTDAEDAMKHDPRLKEFPAGDRPQADGKGGTAVGRGRTPPASFRPRPSTCASPPARFEGNEAIRADSRRWSFSPTSFRPESEIASHGPRLG